MKRGDIRLSVSLEASVAGEKYQHPLDSVAEQDWLGRAHICVSFDQPSSFPVEIGYDRMYLCVLVSETCMSSPQSPEHQGS